MQDDRPLHHLGVGEVFISEEPSIISTVLGSCISVCLYSPETKFGGMIHFANATDPIPKRNRAADYRYGDAAIHALISAFKDLTRESPVKWTAKIVGGANQSANLNNSALVAHSNIAIAQKLLGEAGIRITGEDIGGNSGRKVLFDTGSNRLQVAKLIPQSAQPVEVKNPVKTRVLIIEDSKTASDILTRILDVDPNIEVCGVAVDSYEADRLFQETKPDVVTLDMNLPGRSGLEWLRSFLPGHPVPVIIVSALSLKEGNEIFQALQLGAIDYVQKPSFRELNDVAQVIREKVKNARSAKVLKLTTHSRPVISRNIDLRKVLVFGASTGGTEALRVVMTMMPEKIPPTLIVQHIPPSFSRAFAERLNSLCPFEVKEAEHGDELRPSRVLIAPGGRHMRVKTVGGRTIVEITDDLPVNRHKPSVDYLFDSAAKVFGKNCIGVILTGMGNDGATGLLKIRNQGALTIAQDEKTSVVYGMPKEAAKIGAVSIVRPLEDIAQAVLSGLNREAS